jgi:hypothetical protein
VAAPAATNLRCVTDSWAMLHTFLMTLQEWASLEAVGRIAQRLGERYNGR